MASVRSVLILAVYLFTFFGVNQTSDSQQLTTPAEEASGIFPSIPVDSNEGKRADVLNVTVPRFLRELFLNFSQPNRSQTGQLSKANSIRSYENLVHTSDPCQPMRFKLPTYSEGTEYFKSEVTIYHQVSKESLSRMRNRLKSRQYDVDVCIKLGSSCTPIFNNITISPAYDGWVTFKFLPYFLIAAGQQYVELFITVSHRGRPVSCSNWPLKFITDDSIGQDMIPVHTVYTHKPRASVLRTFLKEALKSPPITNPEPDQSRQRRTPIQGCRKTDLFLRAGWDLNLRQGMTFSKTFNIGYCGGMCNLLTEEKESERLAVLNLAKLHGFMNQTDYPEHCVPGVLESMRIVLIDPSSPSFEFLNIPNFMVKTCMCVA